MVLLGLELALSGTTSSMEKFTEEKNAALGYVLLTFQQY